MLHVQNNRPGDLNGRIFSSQTIAWYDRRNTALTKAFKDLAELQSAQPQLRFSLLLPAAILAGCIGLSIFGEYRAVSITLCGLAALLLCSPWLLRSWQVSAYRNAAKDLTARIKRGEFGWKFLWSDHPLWYALATQLENAHGMSLLEDVMLIPEVEELATPTLTTLVLSTRQSMDSLSTASLRSVATTNSLLVQTAAQKIYDDASPVWLELDERNK